MDTISDSIITQTTTGRLPAVDSWHSTSSETISPFHDNTPYTPRRKTFRGKKVLRKISGFVSRIAPDEEFSNVIFLKDGNEYAYEVRTSLLTGNKIMANGQPFEFIEEIVQSPDGQSTLLVHRYVPSVPASACHMETLPFDKETQENLDLLLKE